MDKASYRINWKRDYPTDPNLRRSINQNIIRRIEAEAKFQSAGLVALFSPLAWEPDIRELWSRAPQRCVFPRVSSATGITFHFVDDLSNLKPGYAGILEPSAEREVGAWTANDLVLVPGYAFDLQGGRIGSGKGFYDRFLQGKPVQKWGVAMDCQVTKEPLAQIATDVRMDGLVTEKRIHWIPRK